MSMANNNKLIELMMAGNSFFEENPDASLEDFYSYKTTVAPKSPVEQKEEEFVFPRERYLPRAIGRVTKTSNMYIKKALSSIGLENIDDYLYLEGVVRIGNPTKTELINFYMNDFTSGIDMIKRLLRLGLLEEYPDDRDKRSKRLKLTEAGMSKLEECRPLTLEVSRFVYHTLDDTEQATLLLLLNKVVDYHQARYKELKGKTFEELKEIFKSV